MAAFEMDMSFYTLINGKYYAPHDIDEVTDFPFRWVDWCADSDDDTIISVLGIYEAPLSLPPGKTNQVSVDGKNCVLWVTGGTDRTTRRLTCRITTAAGRVQDRSIYLRCTANR